MTAPTATPKARPTPGAFKAIYRLILRNQATIGRIMLVVVLGGVGALIGFAIGMSNRGDKLFDGTRMINAYGLTVLVPVVCLVFASSSLGDLVDDKTLVYIWLRPVNRLTVAAAAAAASLTICLPAVTIPLVVSAALTGGGGSLIAGTAVSAMVGTVGYVGLFTALGLRFRRALLWGLAYILLWEGYVSSASKTASRLGLRAYTRSALSEYTGIGLRQADLALGVSIVVPIAVGLVFVFLTSRRLAHTTVD